MITLIILIAAFTTCSPQAIVLVVLALAFFWGIVIGEWKKYSVYLKETKTCYKKNPIDEYGDEHYGTIDWFKDGKL